MTRRDPNLPLPYRHPPSSPPTPPCTSRLAWIPLRNTWLAARGDVRRVDPSRPDGELVPLTRVPATDLWRCVTDDGYTVVSARVPDPSAWVGIGLIAFAGTLFALSLPSETHAAGGLLRALLDVRLKVWGCGAVVVGASLLLVRQLVLMLGTQLVDVAAGRALVEIRLGPLCWRRTYPFAFARRADVRPALKASSGMQPTPRRRTKASQHAELDLRSGRRVTLLRDIDDARRRGVAEGLVDRINEGIMGVPRPRSSPRTTP